MVDLRDREKWNNLNKPKERDAKQYCERKRKGQGCIFQNENNKVALGKIWQDGSNFSELSADLIP